MSICFFNNNKKEEKGGKNLYHKFQREKDPQKERILNFLKRLDFIFQSSFDNSFATSRNLKDLLEMVLKRIWSVHLQNASRVYHPKVLE